jgi:hypothetical protein
VRHSKS